ncbi:MAG: class I SAM-dependent methyltransferase, partial [Pseudomonadota bacterium]|nr:class I SAM-dependent methyltransferase [Pseudomonadota bacterium]
PAEFWYPYNSMSNFHILDKLLTGPNRNLLRDIHPKRAADIGAGDGDMAFFLEQEGWQMTIIDNPPTNFNGLKGARLHRDATGSQVEIVEMNLDSQFQLTDRYDLVFFLGILYHLKNPFYALEQLATYTRYAIVSTRITRWSKPTDGLSETTESVGSKGGSPPQLLEHLPIAYLLGPTECNNDDTNYWIFSDAGLRRLLDRTGWDIEDYLIVGATEAADPFSAAGDARAFCLLKSRHF